MHLLAVSLVSGSRICELCKLVELARLISGAVLGNVLAEAPERLTALSKQQQLQEVSVFQYHTCQLDG